MKRDEGSSIVNCKEGGTTRGGITVNSYRAKKEKRETCGEENGGKRRVYASTLKEGEMVQEKKSALARRK